MYMWILHALRGWVNGFSTDLKESMVGVILAHDYSSPMQSGARPLGLESARASKICTHWDCYGVSI